MRPMARFFHRFSILSAGIACALLLLACSPKFDWREVHDSGIPFSILLPAKPTTSARQIDLDGLPVTMTMTAAEAGDVLFAVGSAEMPDPAAAERALVAMKTALTRNIGGSIRRELASSPGAVPATLDIEAVGAPRNGEQPRLLVARFVAVGKRVYQLVVVGQEKSVPREAVDTFLTSFKPA
ncbi:hypothetical protein FAY22_15420 [Noviherbaspirillum sp. UKPF54]|nr:hypothetical protein FAY22_15420 [Noviherbaspirillum sp. UKPF54]